VLSNEAYQGLQNSEQFELPVGCISGLILLRRIKLGRIFGAFMISGKHESTLHRFNRESRSCTFPLSFLADISISPCLVTLFRSTSTRSTHFDTDGRNDNDHTSHDDGRSLNDFGHLQGRRKWIHDNLDVVESRYSARRFPTEDRIDVEAGPHELGA